MSATPDPAALNARHGLNPPHSEVVQACATVPPGRALDMGCGTGRNAFYLAQLGFDVTAIDANPGALAQLQGIAAHEGLDNIQPLAYDIHQAALGAEYDFIACTVTLMFLDPAHVPAVLADMQACTTPGGHNLIVCAMHTAAHPCPIGFPFTLGEGELAQAYAGWELLKYNEDLGTMHNGAQLQFATLLARKPG